MSSLIIEANSVSDKDSLEYIEDLFVAIDQELVSKSSEDNENHLSTLVSLRIFPTTTMLETPSDISLKTATGDSEWYIPDQLPLAKLFGPQLHVLAFSPTMIFSLGRLLNALGLQSRILSKATKRSITTNRLTGINTSYREWFHTRLGYIKGYDSVLVVVGVVYLEQI